MTINYKVMRDIKFKIKEELRESLDNLEFTEEYKEGYNNCMNGIIIENPYSRSNSYKKKCYSVGYNDAQKTFCDATFDCD